VLLRHVRRERDRRFHQAAFERTRAERDLQDALLQSFQGVLLKVHAATALVLQRPEEALRRLNEAMAQADQAINEARDATQALRPPMQDADDHLRQRGTGGDGT
jgi:signal transduction histidine kinase